jgi:hypothetical protein
MAAALGVAAILASGAVIAVAAPAQAVAPEIFPLHGPHKTVEYGTTWEIYSYIRSYRDDLTLIANVDGSDYYLKNSFYEGHFQLYNNEGGGKLDKALDVGTHLVSMRLQNGGTLVAKSDAPFHLVIGPTAISTTTLITPDPNNASNAIVTAELSGNFIDSLPNCYCESENGTLLPAGTWKITVTESDGTVAFRREQSVAAGKLKKNYSVSGGAPHYVAYWSELPPGENLIATSSFTPDASHAKDFTRKSTPFSYTSAAKAPGATPTATPNAAPAATSQAGGLPFWALLAGLLLALILLILDVVLLILRSRRNSPTVAPTTTVAAEGSAE